MPVLVTCKFDDDLIKQEGVTVSNNFFFIIRENLLALRGK